ncbi:Predicted small integral membrane protein (plasmid) [Legionella adelaidensis]|uniref:Low affinity iron permease n=1 Tax=Legionella adelaidensis TaxID=45056 RepID=A0A0W0R1T2_9GAMM|nr:low affinity iron permease family protein [Legionella adelaidensis]KTC64989.1 Low affinity iron permease [Legionella adelaidensis]VEH85331.1 Predicted small integral membrane protein [Legionella adelaidensis]
MNKVKKRTPRKIEKKSSEGIQFYKIAKKTADILGNFWSFLISVLFCFLWLISGPYFNYSDTWQLVINTSTTVITFLMVFIIQNTQNRDTQILNLKLDELIKALRSADNLTLDLEELSEEELKELLDKYKQLRDKKTGK